MKENKKQKLLGQTNIELKMIREDKEDQQDIFFKNYLIHPIKRVFDLELQEGDITQLEKILGQVRQLPQRSQQQKQLRYKHNVICFTCKDFNSMLMAIYCLFLRNPKKDILKDKLAGQLYKQIPQQKKSTLDKVLMTLQRNMHYYLPTAEEKVMRDPLRQQITQPLLMSYTMNSTQVQINSRLILDIMSTIKGKLSQLLLKLIKDGFKSRQLQKELKDLPKEQSYCFKFGGLTQEIMVIFPYKKKYIKDQDQLLVQNRYKLFLFQNHQCYSTFITKQKSLLKARKLSESLKEQKMANVNPQRAGSGNSLDIKPNLEQEQGNIRKQTQQQKIKQMDLKMTNCQSKQTCNYKMSNNPVAHGQIATQHVVYADVDAWEDTLNVGVVLKSIFVVVILFLVSRVIIKLIIFPHDFDYLGDFLNEFYSCWNP